MIAPDHFSNGNTSQEPRERLPTSLNRFFFLRMYIFWGYQKTYIWHFPPLPLVFKRKLRILRVSGSMIRARIISSPEIRRKSHEEDFRRHWIVRAFDGFSLPRLFRRGITNPKGFSDRWWDQIHSMPVQYETSFRSESRYVDEVNW